MFTIPAAMRHDDIVRTVDHTTYAVGVYTIEGQAGVFRRGRERYKNIIEQLKCAGSASQIVAEYDGAVYLFVPFVELLGLIQPTVDDEGVS